MIFYDCMFEGWCDENDSNFFVDMTPEGDSDERNKTFDSQELFWKWYHSNE